MQDRKVENGALDDTSAYVGTPALQSCTWSMIIVALHQAGFGQKRKIAAVRDSSELIYLAHGFLI